jgi:hypothetical protein
MRAKRAGEVVAPEAPVDEELRRRFVSRRE